MQKEDLLKRMRLFVTLTTMAFVILVVVLLVQFGFIAHYHTELKKAQDQNDAMQQQIEDIDKQLEYYKGKYGEDYDITKDETNR